MKKTFDFRFLGFLIAAVCFAAFALSFANGGASAQQNQQNQNTQRPRQTPTPPASAAPRLSPAPTVTPTPDPAVEDENEVITVKTDLVSLNVRVVDRNGRATGDVKPEEFAVFEDNVPQKIEFVTKEEVAVNYGLVIDNSLSLRSQFEKILEAGKIIVSANKPDDATFLIRFVNREKIDLLLPFTKNQTDLNDAIDNLYLEGGQTAVIDAVVLGTEQAAEYQKEQRREDKSRRAIVLITDGEERDSYYKEEQLFEQLREADVQIYPIGFVNELSKDGSLIKKSPRDKATKLLQRMADETGGKAYFPASVAELPEIARAISNELRAQYVISYAPTNEARDGGFRAIKVTVKDDPKRGRRIPVTRTGRTAPKN